MIGSSPFKRILLAIGTNFGVRSITLQNIRFSDGLLRPDQCRSLHELLGKRRTLQARRPSYENAG